MSDEAQETGPQPDGFDAAGLDALAAQAAELQGTQAAPGSIEQAQPVSTTSDELLAALELVRAMAGPLVSWWPQAADVWSDAQLKAIADAGGKVMDKHGWTMGETMSEWGPYLALAGATLPPAAATFAAIKAHRAELAEAKRASAPNRSTLEPIRQQ